MTNSIWYIPEIDNKKFEKFKAATVNEVEEKKYMLGETERQKRI